MKKALATVIIPTFGDAPFARWALRSVQEQTLQDLEICIICDGSPEHMQQLFAQRQEYDPRIRVLAFPKSPRTGEPYRDIAIRQTSGRIICYCSHDDLWLPDHVREMEKALRRCSFVHSLHAAVNLPPKQQSSDDLLHALHCVDLRNRETRQTMARGTNYFGLTFAGHTRRSYCRLPEGWATTPRADMPTDLFMWQKFLSAFETECRTLPKITALSFPHAFRRTWTAQKRDAELEYFFGRLRDRDFCKGLTQIARSRFPNQPGLLERIAKRLRRARV